MEHSPVCTKIVDLDFNLEYMSSSGIRDLKIEDTAQIYGKPYPFDFYPESFRRVMTGNLIRESIPKLVETEVTPLPQAAE